MMYKYLFCLIVFFNLINVVSAQQSTTNKTTIAPFKIKLVNSKIYTYNQLPKDKPVILVYFSPTCDHCKAFTQAMLQRSKALAGKQIVMISYLPIEDVKQFDSAYQLSSKPNIKIGTEGYTFIVQKYYNIQRFPFVVEYNKAGKVSKMVPYNSTKPEEMAEQL